jgi:hypothetical protein
MCVFLFSPRGTPSLASLPGTRMWLSAMPLCSDRIDKVKASLLKHTDMLAEDLARCLIVTLHFYGSHLI